MGRKKKLPFLEKVEIISLGAEGKAIAKTDQLVTFVKYAAPGDIVDIQVKKKRKNYMEGIVTKFHELSDIRQKPFCDHFGTCGGCKWQHIPYNVQLEFKQKQVFDALTRIGKLELPEISKIKGSEKDTFYRNKLEFTFSAHRWLSQEEIDSGEDINETRALGFHIPGLFNKIVDVHKCWLQEEPCNGIKNLIRDYALQNDLSFFNQKEHNGFLRNLIIRTSTTGEVMVILSFFHEDEKARIKLLDHIYNHYPHLTSLMFVINEKGNDTLYDQEIICYKGRDHIFEELESLKFKIGPKSFFQTNTQQALELYKIARDFADMQENEIVYDLYTGTGTIANFVAKKAKKVIGIESVPEAIEDAKINSEINNISNTEFYSGDIKDMLTNDFFQNHGKPDLIITDPPRAGMHKNVVSGILQSEPEKIVYVSCNPATQARDLELLSEKYRITHVQPVDMFPQTHHVENVVRLVRK